MLVITTWGLNANLLGAEPCCHLLHPTVCPQLEVVSSF